MIPRRLAAGDGEVWAEREGLRGKVQCIYFDPPVWHQIQQQFSVVHHRPPTRRTVKGRPHITREPEASPKPVREQPWAATASPQLSQHTCGDRLTVAPRSPLRIPGSIFVSDRR